MKWNNVCPVNVSKTVDRIIDRHWGKLLITIVLLAGTILAVGITAYGGPNTTFQVTGVVVDYRYSAGGFGHSDVGTLYFGDGRVVQINEARAQILLGKPATWYFEDWGGVIGRTLSGVDY